MRPIEFRGKTLENDWVYGVPVYQNNRCFIISGAADWDEDFFQPERWDTVNPETVGQYTGLKDKEGNNIFEGDILLECGDAIVIKYGMPYEEYKTYMIYGEMDDGSPWIIEDNEDWKIIGNIHDNPELLQ